MGRRRRQAPLEYDILLTATLCLLAFGCIMVFSASSARGVLTEGGTGTQYLIRYAAYGAIGLLAMWALARRGLDAIPKLTGLLLLGAFTALVLVKVPGFGVEVNGATRWLGVGPLVFQPSEVMKLALVLYAVKLLAEKPKRAQRPKELAPLAFVAVPALALVLSQPDLGTALVLGGTAFAILLCAGVPMRLLGAVGAGCAVIVSIYAVSAPYRMARLTSFLDPWAHAADNGFQSVQGQIAIGSGGFFGRGLGESQAKNLFLPEAHTDFILAIVGEEWGVVGILVLLFLYGLIAFAGLRVAKSARGPYAKLLAAGVTSMFLVQATLNVFTVLGLLPLTGVPLPMVSYGSTNLVVLLAAMGLLLNVARGGHVKLRAVPAPRDRAGSRGGERDDRHRRGRDSGARGAGAGSRRRAAG